MTNYVGDFTRDRVTNFAGNFVGNYATTFTGDFVGNYARAFVGDFAGNFVGEYARTSTRTRYSAYTRSRVSTFVGQYANSYSRHRINSYSRTGAAYPDTSVMYDYSNKLWQTGWIEQYWKVGAGVGGWSGGGSTATMIETDTPWGPDVVLDVPNNDVDSNYDGGPATDAVAIDPTKTYRFSMWVRRPVTGNGQTYLGAYNWNNSGANLGFRRVSDPSAAPNTNSYWVHHQWYDLTQSPQDSTANEWYLMVGHVHPVGYTGGEHAESGIYNASGEKVRNVSTDFIMETGTTKLQMRSYLYYSTDATTSQQWAAPRIDDMSHPNVPNLDLLRRATPSYSRTFTGNYTGNYAGNFIGDFVGNFAGNYSRTFVGNYTGEYTRNFVGNFVGNYARGFVGDYVGNYARSFVGNYARVRVSAYSRVRNSAYSGAYARNRVSTYVGDFIGNYSRGFSGQYSRGFTGNYARSFIGNYTGTTIGSGTETTETYTLYVRTA